MRNSAALWGLLLPVIFAACAAVQKPLKDPGHPAVGQLVDLRAQDRGLRFDLRYSTPSNFTGQRLYPVAAAWLHRDAARALDRVQQDLQAEGLGLKIFDAYRPFHVQQQMWNLIHDERYVSNPAKNAGRHTRGTAVDVTLVDRHGRELLMPTAFDDFTERAHRDAIGISTEAKENSLRLERAMVRHGFIPYPFEWWHFDYHGWEQHPPLDVPLTSLGSTNPPVINATR
ncbi:M15 family metallopeptidase [Verrucomicrobiota bacterium sgz303538]